MSTHAGPTSVHSLLEPVDVDDDVDAYIFQQLLGVCGKRLVLALSVARL